MRKRTLQLLCILLILSLPLVFTSRLTGGIIAKNGLSLEVDVPELYKEVLPGNDIWFTIKLMNIANTKNMDVILKYEITDIYKKVKISKTETVLIETQISMVRNLKVPKNAEGGLHFLKVTTLSPTTLSSFAEATHTFHVIQEETKLEFYNQIDKRIYYIFAGLLVFILLIHLIFKSKPWLKKLKMLMKIRKIVKKRRLE